MWSGSKDDGAMVTVRCAHVHFHLLVYKQEFSRLRSPRPPACICYARVWVSERLFWECTMMSMTTGRPTTTPCLRILWLLLNREKKRKKKNCAVHEERNERNREANTNTDPTSQAIQCNVWPSGRWMNTYDTHNTRMGNAFISVAKGLYLLIVYMPSTRRRGYCKLF